MNKQVKYIWVFLVCVSVYFILEDWYSDNYCKNVSIPVRCTKH